MDVVVDVVYAEAVVAGAAGAVAEFQIGVFRVRASADGALSRVGLFGLLLVVLLRRLFEVDGLALLLLPCGADKIEKPAAAEQQIV